MTLTVRTVEVVPVEFVSQGYYRTSLLRRGAVLLRRCGPALMASPPLDELRLSWAGLTHDMRQLVARPRHGLELGTKICARAKRQQEFTTNTS
eukprot:5128623-Amphidinium_carterae.1